MKSFLMIERIVIEALLNSEKSFSDIQAETGLNQEILRSILISFVEDGTIIYSKSKYLADKKKVTSILQSVAAEGGLAEELKSSFCSLVNNYLLEEKKGKKEEIELRYKKIPLTQHEKSVLKRKIEDFDLFIKGIEREKRKSTPKDTLVFFAKGPCQIALEDEVSSIAI